VIGSNFGNSYGFFSIFIDLETVLFFGDIFSNKNNKKSERKNAKIPLDL
jgi:hypothetical protein